MFAITILGSILLVGAVFAVVRHFRQEKIECGPLHPCLGGSSKQNQKSAA